MARRRKCPTQRRPKKDTGLYGKKKWCKERNIVKGERGLKKFVQVKSPQTTRNVVLRKSWHNRVKTQGGVPPYWFFRVQQ